MYVCLYVCMFQHNSGTPGPFSTKLGIRVPWYMEMVPPYWNPRWRTGYQDGGRMTTMIPLNMGVYRSGLIGRTWKSMSGPFWNPRWRTRFQDDGLGFKMAAVWWQRCPWNHVIWVSIDRAWLVELENQCPVPFPEPGWNLMTGNRWSKNWKLWKPV